MDINSLRYYQPSKNCIANLRIPCPRCNTTGYINNNSIFNLNPQFKIWKEKCPRCAGSGNISAYSTYKYPPFIDSEMSVNPKILEDMGII